MKKELKTIIVDSFLEKEYQILEKNLNKDKEKEQTDLSLCVWNGGGKLSDLLKKKNLLAQQSLLLSGEEKHLLEAKKLGVARVGFSKPDEDAFLSGADMVIENVEDLELDLLYKIYQREHQIPWTILTTKRCVVRELALSDLDALFALYQGEGMTDYMEPLYSYEEEMEYQKSYISYMYQYYGFGMWLVFDKETKELIGRAGIECREELGGEPELGYAIGRPFWRQGYATEVCVAILQYVRENLGFTRINCLMEKGNEASVRLAQKLGFVYQEDMDLDGKRMERYCFSWDEKETL